MKAMLRRAHLRIDVTTEQGERKALTLSARPGPEFAGLIKAIVIAVVKASGFDLVDETEQALEASPASSFPDVASSLTVPVTVVVDSPPSSPVVASPSAALASRGDLSPALKHPRVFGNARSSSSASSGASQPVKHVVRDAHRRIEATRESGADVVIGPRDVTPVGGTQRVSSAVVVGQTQQPAVIVRPEAAARLSRVGPPDYAAPAQKRKRVGS